MGQQDELEVLDAHPLLTQAALQRRQSGVVARTGVHQRQRLALQQPGVDRADVGERERDGGDVTT